jgi:hypothetical protein
MTLTATVMLGRKTVSLCKKSAVITIKDFLFKKKISQLPLWRRVQYLSLASQFRPLSVEEKKVILDFKKASL